MSILDTVRDRLSGQNVSDLVNGIDLSRGAVVRYIAYAVYGVTLFCLFFAVKHFAAGADAMVRERLGGLEGVVVDIPRIEADLVPPGCMLEYVRLYDKQTHEPLLLMKETDVRLAVLPLLMGKLELKFSGRVYGGMLDGVVSFGSWGGTDVVELDVAFDMVELERIPQVQAYDPAVRGFWSGEASLEGDPADFRAMTGSIRTTVAQLNGENRLSIIAGDRLSGFRAVLEGSLEKGVLTADPFSLTHADGLELIVSGTMTVNGKRFERSKLDLKGTFVGPPAMLAGDANKPAIRAILKQNEPVSVTVGGSFYNLRIGLGR